MIFTINSSSVLWLFMHAFYERKERKQMLKKVTWLRSYWGWAVKEGWTGRDWKKGMVWGRGCFLSSFRLSLANCHLWNLESNLETCLGSYGSFLHDPCLKSYIFYSVGAILQKHSVFTRNTQYWAFLYFRTKDWAGSWLKSSRSHQVGSWLISENSYFSTKKLSVLYFQAWGLLPFLFTHHWSFF